MHIKIPQIHSEGIHSYGHASYDDPKYNWDEWQVNFPMTPFPHDNSS